MSDAGGRRRHPDTPRPRLDAVWHPSQGWMVPIAALMDERAACARIAAEWAQRKDGMTDTAFVPGATSSEKFAADGIAAAIRARGDTPDQ